MAVIAASIAGAAAVVGGGLSYAGARKQAKAATAANKRNIAAAKDANYAEQINEAMRRGTPGIYPGMPRAEYNSVMQDLPAAVAFAQYADEATGEKGFEKNVFADMVSAGDQSIQLVDVMDLFEQSRTETVGGQLLTTRPRVFLPTRLPLRRTITHSPSSKFGLETLQQE